MTARNSRTPEARWPDHDGDYKNVFSYPETVEALLRGFVRERWVERLDFSTLGKASASFVSERLRARYGDTVWKVRLAPRKGKKGPWLYVFLLLEFQSTPAPFMAVRMLGYVGRAGGVAAPRRQVAEVSSVAALQQLARQAVTAESLAALRLEG